jgi:crossover junction endodeoxyribonuclease RuvC
MTVSQGNRIQVIRVMGIDPGLSITGFGIIEKRGNQLQALSYGTIRPPAGRPLPQRLRYLYDEVCRLIGRYRPQVLAIEDSFYRKNVKSAIAMGQARGSILLAGAHQDLPCVEYAPRRVKQAVVGNGAATKEQVQFMVQRILRLKDLPKPLDSSDALAIGLCHLNKVGWSLP